MTTLKYKPRNRTTDFIPAFPMSEEAIHRRTIPRKVYLDENLLNYVLNECGTRPLPEKPPIPKRTPPEDFCVLGFYIPTPSGCQWSVTALQEARNECLTIDKAAMKAFVSFSLAQCTDLSTLGSDVVLVDDDVIRCQFKGGVFFVPGATAAPEPESSAFYEPITFEWTKKDDELMEAAKKYSEQTHADY